MCVTKKNAHGKAEASSDAHTHVHGYDGHNMFACTCIHLVVMCVSILELLGMCIDASQLGLLGPIGPAPPGAPIDMCVCPVL